MIALCLAEGFEEVEALAPLDILRRAGVSVTVVGVTGDAVTGSHGIIVQCEDTIDMLMDPHSFGIKDRDPVVPEMIILPGGMPGTLRLSESARLTSLVRQTYEAGGKIAAICAAPSVPGKMGLLSGRKAVCYPGFEDTLLGAIHTDDRVVEDGPFITAVGMGAAVEFGLCLVRVLCGRGKEEEIASAVLCDKSLLKRLP